VEWRAPLAPLFGGAVPFLTVFLGGKPIFWLMSAGVRLHLPFEELGLWLGLPVPLLGVWLSVRVLQDGRSAVRRRGQLASWRRQDIVCAVAGILLGAPTAALMVWLPLWHIRFCATHFGSEIC
jgi:hypothetical protein